MALTLALKYKQIPYFKIIYYQTKVQTDFFQYTQGKKCLTNNGALYPLALDTIDRIIPIETKQKTMYINKILFCHPDGSIYLSIKAQLVIYHPYKNSTHTLNDILKKLPPLERSKFKRILRQLFF